MFSKGKPLAEARGEIQYSASFFDWYAGEARRVFGQVVPAPKLNRQHYHLRQPIGVIAVITPASFSIIYYNFAITALLKYFYRKLTAMHFLEILHLFFAVLRIDFKLMDLKSFTMN